jgi:hypothetical protein
MKWMPIFKTSFGEREAHAEATRIHTCFSAESTGVEPLGEVPQWHLHCYFRDVLDASVKISPGT